jgi:hypothetical protein
MGHFACTLPFNPIATARGEHPASPRSEVNRGQYFGDRATSGETGSATCEQTHSVLRRRVVSKDHDSDRRLARPQTLDQQRFNGLIENGDPWRLQCDLSLERGGLEILGEDTELLVFAQDVCQAMPNERIKATN